MLATIVFAKRVVFDFFGHEVEWAVKILASGTFIFGISPGHD
jgi:hypothetical protein